MGKKAVIFDMDGVIFDTERVYLEIWQSVFEKYGYKMTKELYITVMGTGRKNVIKTAEAPEIESVFALILFSYRMLI